jgi:hypothetical protein
LTTRNRDQPVLVAEESEVSVCVAVALDIPIPVRIIRRMLPKSTLNTLRGAGLSMIVLRKIGLCVRPSELKRFMDALVQDATLNPVDRTKHLRASVAARKRGPEPEVESAGKLDTKPKRSRVIIT